MNYIVEVSVHSFLIIACSPILNFSDDMVKYGGHNPYTPGIKTEIWQKERQKLARKVRNFKVNVN